MPVGVEHVDNTHRGVTHNGGISRPADVTHGVRQVSVHRSQTVDENAIPAITPIMPAEVWIVNVMPQHGRGRRIPDVAEGLLLSDMMTADHAAAACCSQR